MVRVTFYGHFDGLYLFTEGRFRVTIADDVILGAEGKLLWGVYVRTVGSNLHRKESGSTVPYLEYDWSAADGSGFVRNEVPGASG